MLSLRELKRAARILSEGLSGATLRRMVQPDSLELILVFEQQGSKSPVLISCQPEYARISLADRAEPAASSSSFFEYGRAHLPGMSLSGFDVSETNRQVCLRLQKNSDRFVLILSILGARSNLYLLDSRGKLAHSMRPLEETRRELKIGEPWQDPRGTVPDEGIDRWEELPDEEYLEAIAQFYTVLQQKREAERLFRRIEQAIRKERAFLDRKAINLQQDLGEAKQAETHRQKGELLKGVLHRIQPGDESITATDYRTGEAFEIPLDPKLSPAANLESYFARYQKESRGVRMIEQQQEELETARAQLDGIRLRLEQAGRGEMPDFEALQELASLPGVRRLIERASPRKRPVLTREKSAQKKQIPARLMPKRFRTQDGLEIWVGRSDEGNDFLTTRLARGNDLFFHLEGYPGSHVILRTEGRPDPPPKSLLDACELAVHFSRMKSAGSADVHVAPVKNVKKPKGVKPGLVYVRSGRTIHLRRDPKRLQNILSSRMDQ